MIQTPTSEPESLKTFQVGTTETSSGSERRAVPLRAEEEENRTGSVPGGCREPVQLVPGRLASRMSAGSGLESVDFEIFGLVQGLFAPLPLPRKTILLLKLDQQSGRALFISWFWFWFWTDSVSVFQVSASEWWVWCWKTFYCSDPETKPWGWSWSISQLLLMNW